MDRKRVIEILEGARDFNELDMSGSGIIDIDAVIDSKIRHLAQVTKFRSSYAGRKEFIKANPKAYEFIASNQIVEDLTDVINYLKTLEILDVEET